MSENTTEAGDESETKIAPADEVDGQIMHNVGRLYGIGAGAVKGALRFDPPETESDCKSTADEAALEARRRAADQG